MQVLRNDAEDVRLWQPSLACFVGEARQSLYQEVSWIEESLDFRGEDTRESLGAVRLRKVQQKIVRWCAL